MKRRDGKAIRKLRFTSQDVYVAAILKVRVYPEEIAVYHDN